MPIGLISKFLNKTEIRAFFVTGCKDLNELKGNEFENGVAIEKLKITDTNLSIINVNSFTNLKSLTYLDLSSNNLETLEDKIFNGLDKMSVLKLSHNRIKCLQENIFKFNTHLTQLFATHNQISYIGLKQFKNIHLRLGYFEENNCTVDNYTYSTNKTFLQFLCSKNCSDETFCISNNDEQPFVQNYLIAITCVTAFFVIDIIVVTVMITKHVRSIRSEDGCHVYEGFQFYETPKLIHSMLR